MNDKVCGPVSGALWFYGTLIVLESMRAYARMCALAYDAPEFSTEQALAQLAWYRDVLRHSGVTPQRADPGLEKRVLTRAERRAHALYLCAGVLERANDSHTRHLAPKYLAAVRAHLEHDHLLFAVV